MDELFYKGQYNDSFFAIPMSLGYIIYAPLHKYIRFANSVDAEIIKEELERHKAIDITSKSINYWGHAIIILSQNCNLGCSYCYAQRAHSAKGELSTSQLRSIIDFVIQQKCNSRKSVSFIGGGEPLVSWDKIEWALKYIREKSPEEIHVRITTNATLLNEERIKVLKKHNVHLIVSFDILPLVQNKQRPYKNDKQSFADVNNSLKLLLENGVDFRIRSTITNLNVGLMLEMTQFVDSNYKGVHYLQFEPVTDNQLTEGKYYDKYLDSFFCARRYGMEHGIRVENSITTSVDYVRTNFCEGEFCITPDGTIVTCHRQSTKNDKFFEKSVIGTVDETLNINSSPFGLQKVIRAPKKCSTCFAKWNCAGFCHLEWDGMSPANIERKCDFIRECIRRVLRERIEINAEPEKL